jgi:hypothetical protein
MTGVPTTPQAPPPDHAGHEIRTKRHKDGRPEIERRFMEQDTSGVITGDDKRQDVGHNDLHDHSVGTENFAISAKVFTKTAPRL